MVPAHHTGHLMGRLLLFYEVCLGGTKILSLRHRGLIALHRRPRSMVGGDLHWIWEPYGLYQEIDYVRASLQFECGCGALTTSVIWVGERQVYGVKALQENSGFPDAQCKSPFIALVA